MEEVWEDIPGYEGSYQASTLGRIRSLDRMINCRSGQRKHRGRILALTPQKSGHLNVELKVDGVCQKYRVHRLVLLTFVGPPKKNQECLHVKSDPSNNKLENLKWGTRKENIQQIVLEGYHGTKKRQRPVEINGVVYDGVNEASRQLKIAPSSIHHRCNHNRLHTEWRFKDGGIRT